jgi:predicted HTH domain antitoxin
MSFCRFEKGETAMQTVQIALPEEPLISLKETPDSFANEMKILAAVKLFELGRLSSGRAAQLAGVSRVAFLMILGRYQVSPFSLTPAELEQDIKNA